MGGGRVGSHPEINNIQIEKKYIKKIPARMMRTLPLPPFIYFTKNLILSHKHSGGLQCLIFVEQFQVNIFSDPCPQKWEIVRNIGCASLYVAHPRAASWLLFRLRRRWSRKNLPISSIHTQQRRHVTDIQNKTRDGHKHRKYCRTEPDKSKSKNIG